MMEINYAFVGDRIAAKRKQLKMTQAEVAEKTGLTPKYISKIESSKNISLSIKSILKICKALDVSPNYLLLGTMYEDKNANQINVAQKLTLCDDNQLRQVSKFIDAILTE